jgi:multiple sugar transport system ATP-binding protein
MGRVRMAGVTIRKLTKRYGKIVAVNNLDLDIEDKAFIILLGPSGCGKTTTLRCIAGLETPDEGEIRIGDTLVNDLHPKDRDIAMVFQSYALYPHMTAFDNIAFPLKMRNVPKNEIKERVKRTADLLRITHFLDRKPGQLSGGEKQRVALGRAIVRDPKVFLMDEPLSNLDAKLRLQMRTELKRLQRELKVTTIYVTHDQVEAMTMGDKIAIMESGALQQFDFPTQIFNSPASLFVAGFVGSLPMNLLDCNLTEKNGSYALDSGTFIVPITANMSELIKKSASTSELILGIRPEEVSLTKECSPDAFIEGEVYVTELLGTEVIIHIKMGDSLLKVKTSADFDINTGEKVWIGFRKDKIHIFDKKTEKAIL